MELKLQATLTWTDHVEKVAHVLATGQIPALAMGSEGTLYGAGGMKGYTQILRWHPASEQIENFWNLRDPESGAGPARIHQLAVDDTGCLFLAENHNHERSSYLWSTRPADMH